MDYLSLLQKIQKLVNSLNSVHHTSGKNTCWTNLKSASNNLVNKNISIALKDLDGVIAAFDGWTNVQSEHLFGVVFIASEGKAIRGAKDISSERSKTQDLSH